MREYGVSGLLFRGDDKAAYGRAGDVYDNCE